MSIDVSRSCPVRVQVIMGVLCGILDLLVNFLQEHFNPVPLFMDTLFTITASFFGGISGVISAALYRVLTVAMYAQRPLTLSWILVSVSLVLIVRLYVRLWREFSAMDIVLLSFIAGIVISVEGALVFTALHTFAEYREDSLVRQMYLFLKSNSLPLFLSALLPRVPINLLDKGICVPLGFFVYAAARKITPPRATVDAR